LGERPDALDGRSRYAPAVGSDVVEQGRRLNGKALAGPPISVGPSSDGVSTPARAFAPALELPVVALVAAVLELVTLAARMPRDGLFQDDWPLAAISHFGGFSGLFQNLVTVNPLRPVAAVWFAFTSAVGPPGSYVHALAAPATHLLFVTLAYALLRELGLGRVCSGAIAALVLLFPFSDANWLWYTDSSSGLGLSFAAGGALVSVRSLSASGRRAVLMDVAAGSLFALSVLTYQFAALAVLLMGIVYVRRADRAGIVRRMAINVGAVVGAVLVPFAIAGSTGTSAAPTAPVSQWPGHALHLLSRGATLLVNATVPFGSPHRNVVAPTILVLLCIGVIAYARGTGEEVRRWLSWAAFGVALTVCAYLVFVPTPNGFYDPLVLGPGNRINALAGVGDSIFIVSCAMLAGELMKWRFPGLGRVAMVAPAGLLIVVFVGYFSRLHGDVGSWSRAWSAQRVELARLWPIGRPPANSTDYVFGGFGAVRGGIDAFGQGWELEAAADIHWNDSSLADNAVFIGTQIHCNPGEVTAIGGPGALNPTASYGHALFTDLRTGRRQLITSRNACESAMRRFVPGPADVPFG
jgi:hypothetical protein